MDLLYHACFRRHYRSFEDTYNTLKYANRAKKIKVNLKKNVMSVNFHVGQYAKIVEDLKSEINILKRKVASLEEENDGLRDEVSLSDAGSTVPEF